jgi:Lon-like ATP-dependent protease
LTGPQAKASCGLGDADVEITEGAVDVLIKWYARESGVRNLKKYIEKVRFHRSIFPLVRKKTGAYNYPVFFRSR